MDATIALRGKSLRRRTKVSRFSSTLCSDSCSMFLNPNKRVSVTFSRGKARRSVMLREAAHRLEDGARPALFKRSRAHVVGTRNHRRRKEEGVIELDAAQIARQVDLFNLVARQYGDVIYKTPEHPLDLDSVFCSRKDTGRLTRSLASGAIYIAEHRGSSQIVFEGQGTQDVCNGYVLGAGARAGSVMAKQAAAYFGCIV